MVSGITMSFQFGTNWPGYMNKAGNIAGPLLGYEVLTAFFLEATFLGVMLFGRDRVPPWLHTLSAIAVAIGTTVSAFWILALNSWMQTPQGYTVIDGQLHAADWFAIIFNPSFPYRLVHMLLASALTTCFLIAGLSAYQLLRKRDFEPAQRMLRLGVIVAAFADSGADPRRRSTRSEHARAPAGQSRGDGRALEHRARRARGAVRLAGRQGKAQPICDRASIRRKSDPHAQPRG